MSELERIKDLQFSFSGFLWKNLDKIQEAWDAGEFTIALNRACRLVVFLPVAVKERLEPDAQKITDLMNRASALPTHNFHTKMLAQNLRAREIAMLYLKPFMDKMLRLLDERGYLERGALKQITKEDMSKLEEEE